MLSRASCAVVRIFVLAFLIVLPSRAQESNSTNTQAPGKAKALDVNWLYGACVQKANRDRQMRRLQSPGKSGNRTSSS
jgi:hypothetical protein